MNNDTEQPRFSTMHELRFIENIGLNQFGGFLMESRKSLIVKYIKAAQRRVDWANIDKDIVLSTAKKLLKEAAK
jgi:hypothetical protein